MTFKLQDKGYSSVAILIFLFFLITSLNTGCQSSSNVNGGGEVEEEWVNIRVLSYNIFHGEKTNGEIDMEVFADIIKDQDPDLVALQEVDKGVARSNHLDITSELSGRTGLDGYFVKFRNYKDGEYGVAILSKYPVEEIDIIGAYSTSVYRTLPFAKINITNEQSIYFNSSHLATNDAERRKHTKQLAAYYNEELNQAPLIIAGDLNAEPDSPEMDVLLDQFEISDKELRNTFSTRTGMRKKIDFVLYPSNENWEVQETQSICRVDASDHCALLSVLKYKASIRR